MATIHSTIISGAGASSALLPLLAGKTSILLVTDKNVGALEATRAIHRLLAAEGREVEVIDSVPAEPNHHDVTQIVSQLGASQPQMVVGIGGERTDVAKLLSVLLHPEAPSLTSLLAGEQPQRRICSLLIPATAGTGSKRRRTPFWRSPSSRRRWGSSPGAASGLCRPAAGADHQHAAQHRGVDRNRCSVSSAGVLYLHRRQPGER